MEITLEELSLSLERRTVVDVLNEIHRNAQRWNKGGALIHRVRGFGAVAECGARNISEGNTPLKTESTFSDMRTIDKKMYDDTLNFMYMIVKSGLYVP